MKILISKQNKKAVNGELTCFLNVKTGESLQKAFKYTVVSATIIHSFEICRASPVIKNSKYPCVEIKKLSTLSFPKVSSSNSGTGVLSIVGHVTCPANFKRAVCGSSLTGGLMIHWGEHR